MISSRLIPLALLPAALAQTFEPFPNVHYDVDFIPGKCSASHPNNCLYSTVDNSCDQLYTFNQNPRWIAAMDPAYTGDPAPYDFTVEAGEPQIFNGVLRTPLLPPRVNGSVIGQATILATTRYLQYGSIEFKGTKGQGSTVITSLNTMSNSLDEIDIEFTGVSPTEIQTNWYYRGNETSRGQHFAIANTNQSLYDTPHTFRIDWFPDALSFYVNNQLINTVPRSTTCSTAANGTQVCGYPSDPSRIKFGVWNAQVGDWAGRTPVNWNLPANRNKGIFATYEYIRIKCMDAANNPNSQPSNGQNATAGTTARDAATGTTSRPAATNTAGADAKGSGSGAMGMVKPVLGLVGAMVAGVFVLAL
ncbi:hypothetical protein HK097_005421 [Rhizophlyctis rosea]|uniref:GH16 domain-containing protein n=1 Tax=Rhizophlyctis rosea TaxID=64517 RepID=A0AAD5X2H5_9FUNG|nr:hypothetical protein HK097_005421 [Rhizophlyctis rosea]